ncbi:MAG: IPT/TIG domain-containing protein [Myxococcales bacterium]|nr:IPT/TIG domain-containing protein [Myxococcales bacterium]
MRAAIATAIALAALASTGCKNQKLTFESVNPPSGRLGGNEEVRIRGTGFGQLGNLQDVRFGGRAATNVGVQGDDTIVLTSPEGREDDANRAIDITLLSSDGRSIVLKGAFTYRPGAAGGPAGPNDDLRRRL